MNAGEAVAKGQWLLFLHVDTRLPDDPFPFLCATNPWGFYAVKLSGKQRCFRIIEWMITWRSRLTGVATGDQCLFVQRALFEQLQGFADIHLMEDVELSKRLRKKRQPLCIRNPVNTSSRRWERHGIIRTVLLMWYLRLLYVCGVLPHHLVRQYYGE